MDTVQFYAIAAGGCIALVLIIRFVAHLAKLLTSCSTWLHKHVLFPMIVRRHRFLGPWTRAQVLSQLIYLAANIFCLSFRAPNVAQVSVRAGHLSLINMMPAYFGCHLSFICDILGVPLSAYRLFHASTGTMSIVLALLHVVIHVVPKVSPVLDGSGGLYGLVVSDVSPKPAFSAESS